MKTKLTALLALLIAALAAPARGDDKAEPSSFKPALVARLAALDDLIADLRYVVKLAGREEEADQFEKLLKARTGPNGLEGVDTKKPIGAYALVNEKELTQSQVMFLLPIADKKTFLSFLENLDLKPTENKDGSYQLSVDTIPTGPILMRFAHGYLYAMPRLAEKQTIPEEGKLPKPAVALAGGGLLSAAVNVEAIPEQVRKVVVSGLALQLGNLKDQKPEGETAKQAAFREALLDEATAVAKSLLEEGRSLSLKLALDRKKHDLDLAVKLAGRQGTSLAKSLSALGRAEGLGAALMSKAPVMGGYAQLRLPVALVKAMGPAIDEGLEKAVKEMPEDQRKLAGPLVKALGATLKAGALDGAVDLRGPGKGGKYTFVSGLRVKAGADIEKAIRDALPGAPADVRKLVKLDVAKVGDVSIHQVEQKLDAGGKELFGDGPLYFAVSKDAALAAMGEGALEALKAALAAGPKAGALARLEVSMAALAPLLKDRKGAAEAAKKAFKGQGDDKVVLSLTGGEALELRLSLRTAVLAFAAMLDRAEKADQ